MVKIISILKRLNSNAINLRRFWDKKKTSDSYFEIFYNKYYSFFLKDIYLKTYKIST